MHSRHRRAERSLSNAPLLVCRACSQCPPRASSGSVSRQVASCCQCCRLWFGERPGGRIGGRNDRALSTTSCAWSNVEPKAGKARSVGVSDVGQARRNIRSWAEHTKRHQFHGSRKRESSLNMNDMTLKECKGGSDSSCRRGSQLALRPCRRRSNTKSKLRK